ncbi:MAG: M36 family metallopeptidase [Saprospiraceae bacterium]|nr:M36 family metallopeptidase [Saprospiraceae bacterium]
MNFNSYSRVTAVVWFVSLAIGHAQENRIAREQALRFLQKEHTQFNLSLQDVSDTRITDAYESEQHHITHVWIQQQFVGIPVLNAMIGLHVDTEGKIYHLGHRFVPELARRVNTTLPSLSAPKALQIVAAYLGLGSSFEPELKSKDNEKNWLFEGNSLSRKDIPVSAVYVDMLDDGVRLGWKVVVDQVGSADWWTICVDAQTGQILKQFNHTVYCKIDHLGHHDYGSCEDHLYAESAELPAIPVLADEQYRVFEFPVESPSHGNRTLATNPADLLASPFGWLDTNGVAGHEFTYTRGNNVWAFEDRMDDDTPSEAESASGGANLLFDFPFSLTSTPSENRNAAIANLFYSTNKMHDFTYRFGFNEAAGNFQVNNYGNPGQHKDPVLAQALDGSELAEPTLNNANFATPPDGTSGRMQMYLWNNTGGGIVKVNAPGSVAGTYFGGQDTWGGAVTNVPLTAETVFVNDGLGEPVGCFGPPVNNVTGKIVMVDRGSCDFSEKAYWVQQGGGVACIICDHESPPLNGFLAGDYANEVTIPALWIKKDVCDLLRQVAGQGLNISLVQPTVAGPTFVDGDFDNGIIAHEFAHGVSNRLTGGPANTDCLQNGEHMGEGWSDFFMLATSVKPGDSPTTKRGFGTFVYRQPNDGNGLRRYPYSTDMSINPVTYSTVSVNPQLHARGEIWAATLWDLYWAMVEKYGYDPDLNNTSSGNFRAIQLVMDGMKIQPCAPGFIDGRNAIMLADKMYYGGADTCLISTVFARRGMGYLADQKSNENATDGVENFDPIPVCVKELKIKKTTSTPVLNPGETAQYQITVTNHKGETLTNVVVSDELPNGMTLISASNGGTAIGNAVVWNLGALANGQVQELSYTAATAENVGSLPFFYDIMDSDENWYSITYHPANNEFFVLQSDQYFTGTGAWLAPELSNAETNFSLESNLPITIQGSKPILRFWHRYDTEPSADAGFVEFLDINDPFQVWKRVTNEVTFRNGYPAKVSYGTGYPFAYPNHYGFSGTSNGWVQSYFDMSQFIGQTINLRFHFGTNASFAPPNGGWIVDEVEFMDMFNYDTEACVTADGNLSACDRADERGIVMNPSMVNTDEPVFSNTALLVIPNPASDFFSVRLNESMQGDVQLKLFSPDGRLVQEQQVQSAYVGQLVQFNTSQLPKGVYLLHAQNSNQKTMAKVVVK